MICESIGWHWTQKAVSGKRQSYPAGTPPVEHFQKVMTMNEVAKAIADHDGAGAVDWVVNSPLNLLDEMRPMCDATDEFLLDHPGFRVTIVIERRPGLVTGTPGLLAGGGSV